MNIDQLEAVIEIVRSGYNMSSAANRLNRSQSGVSRQVQDLEAQVKYRIFIRSRNRITGLTEQGRELHEICQRMVGDAASLKVIGTQASPTTQATLRIATTHMNAKYLLPEVITKFSQQHPNVQLSFRQGTTEQCCAALAAGEADIAVTAFVLQFSEKILAIPVYSLPRIVLVPLRHPLIAEKKLSFAKLAEYPLITFSQTDPGRNLIEEVFAKKGLHPRFVCTGLDADVCKMYVGLGLGIAILIKPVYQERQDRNLVALDASGLFPAVTLGLMLRKFSYFNTYMQDFTRLFAPRLKLPLIVKALESGTTPASLRSEITHV